MFIIPSTLTASRKKKTAWFPLCVLTQHQTHTRYWLVSLWSLDNPGKLQSILEIKPLPLTLVLSLSLLAATCCDNSDIHMEGNPRDLTDTQTKLSFWVFFLRNRDIILWKSAFFYQTVWNLKNIMHQCRCKF